MVLLNTAHYKESNEKRKSNLCMYVFNYCTTFTCLQNISYRKINPSLYLYPKFKSRLKLDLNFTSFSSNNNKTVLYVLLLKHFYALYMIYI